MHLSLVKEYEKDINVTFNVYGIPILITLSFPIKISIPPGKGFKWGSRRNEDFSLKKCLPPWLGNEENFGL